jgi:hypothetical protein
MMNVSPDECCQMKYKMIILMLPEFRVCDEKKVMQNEDFDHFEPVFCGPEPWKKLYHKPTIKTSLFTISLKNQRCLQNPSLRCHMFFKIVDCNSNLTQLYFYLMFCILLKSL